MCQDSPPTLEPHNPQVPDQAYTFSRSGQKEQTASHQSGLSCAKKLTAHIIEYMPANLIDPAAPDGYEAALSEILRGIDPSWRGPRPTTVEEFEGVVPFQGSGLCDSGEDWYFRFRGDRVSLCIYGQGTTLLEPRLEVSCWELSGRPYAGSLSRDEAIRLVSALWGHLGEGDIPSTGFRELLNERTFNDPVTERLLQASIAGELEAIFNELDDH